MIIGDLDLDWAEQNPGYLARAKAFLVSIAKSPAVSPERLPPARPTDRKPDSATPEHALR